MYAEGKFRQLSLHLKEPEHEQLFEDHEGAEETPVEEESKTDDQPTRDI